MGQNMRERNPACITIADCLFVLTLVGVIASIWRSSGIFAPLSLSRLGSDPLGWAELWIPVLLAAPACALWRMGRSRTLRMYSGEVIGLVGAALPVAMVGGFVFFSAHSPGFYVCLLLAYPFGIVALGAVGMWCWDSQRVMPWTHNLGIAFALFQGVLLLLFVAANMR